MKQDYIKVIVCPADSRPSVRIIPNELEALQEQVGGCVEVVGFTTDVAIICNADGRRLAMPENHSLPVPGFVGDCLLVATDEDEFAGLTMQQLHFLLSQCQQRWQTHLQDELHKALAASREA